ncbi:MAG: alpha-ketoglutarate-dependent dioxygenase AlkB [bacterium]
MEFLPNFLSDQQAQRLAAWCLQSGALKWQQESFSIYGRQITAPRWSAWFGDDGLNYRYSGTDHRTSGWPDELRVLLNQVNVKADCRFNFVLVNRYDDGSHYMGWHRDDETGAGPVIASVSVGGTRRFRYRTAPGTASTAIDLSPGSLLIFDGRLQHTLTRTARNVPVRINLTFRSIH